MQTQLSYPLLFEAEVHNTLGESIIWDARRGVFLWTDIIESKLFSLDYSTRAIQVWDLPYRAGSLGLTEDPEILVVAFEQGIALLSLEDGEIEWLFQPPLAEGVRFNDGRVSPDGLFCAGTMNELDEHSEDVLGALYRVDSEGDHKTLVEQVGVSNGLCWSPDGATMYFADSPKQTISCYRYLADCGAVSDKSTFAKTSDKEFPDGAICDRNGQVWSAIWGGGKVLRYDSSGNIIGTLLINSKQPTCTCIGGPELDILAVTSARAGLSDQLLTDMPSSGNVFFYQLPESAGVEEHQFVLAP